MTAIRHPSQPTPDGPARNEEAFDAALGHNHATVREHVARRLKELREAHGLKPGKLAKKLGLSPAVLKSYESGLRPISAGVLFELASALDTPIALFFESLPPTARSGDEDDADRPGDDLIAHLMRIKDPSRLMRLSAFVRFLATNADET